MTLKFFHQPLKPLLFDIKHCYRDGQQKCIKMCKNYVYSPSLTFFSVNVIQEVDGVLHHTVTHVAVVSEKILKYS